MALAICSIWVRFSSSSSSGRSRAPPENMERVVGDWYWGRGVC